MGGWNANPMGRIMPGPSGPTFPLLPPGLAGGVTRITGRLQFGLPRDFAVGGLASFLLGAGLGFFPGAPRFLGLAGLSFRQLTLAGFPGGLALRGGGGSRGQALGE